jgi:Fur family iron response transcriptional regulator
MIVVAMTRPERSDPSMTDPVSAFTPPATAAAPLRGCPLSDLRDKLRRVGLRPTRQRVSLGWLLFGKGDRHVTAEVLFEEAGRARVPVSLATVYNTLHQFTQAGLLRQLAVDGTKAYFDTNPSDHHHFFLEHEGTLVDMPSEGVTVGDLPAPPPGMEVAGVEVIVRLRPRVDRSES